MTKGRQIHILCLLSGKDPFSLVEVKLACHWWGEPRSAGGEWLGITLARGRGPCSALMFNLRWVVVPWCPPGSLRRSSRFLPGSRWTSSCYRKTLRCAWEWWIVLLSCCPHGCLRSARWWSQCGFLWMMRIDFYKTKVRFKLIDSNAHAWQFSFPVRVFASHKPTNWSGYSYDWRKLKRAGAKVLESAAYLTRFSAAITLVETALPRAWSSISSWLSRYFLPKKT